MTQPLSGDQLAARTARRSAGRLALLPVASAGLILVVALWVAAPGLSVGVSAVALFGVIAAFVLTRIGDSHPFPTFGAANWVTLFRAILACLLVVFLSAEALAFSIGAFMIAAVALLLDGVDGWLARRFATSSRFGARFDMEIDALLIFMLSCAAFIGQKAGAWVLALGLMRYVFVGASVVWPWLGAELPPSFRRKAICVVQVATLAILLLPAIVPPVSTTIAAAALAMLVASFASDIRWLAERRP